MNQRNEMLANRIIIALVVAIIVGFYTIRHANQVAHQNELNSQLIHEQQKVQANEKEISQLKAQINSLEQQTKELINASEELKSKNADLLNQNEDLSKKFRELAKP